MSNSLDPDQARHFVGPDLGPNCSQMLSPDEIKSYYLISLLFLETIVPDALNIIYVNLFHIGKGNL